MKILTILGVRPQFIKAGTVSRAIMKYNKSQIKYKKIEEIIVHTGQHFDSNMSDIFFNEMKIPKPHYNLDINGLGHGAMTGQMLEKIEEVLLEERPDWVLVYGDTNSTLAGALAASKLHIKVAHIEAGLRSFNMKMPEEVNRILTDRISNILFCPTDRAVENLKNEGFPFKLATNHQQLITNVGDVMLDGAMFYKELAQKPEEIGSKKWYVKNYILCTIHRAENTDDPKRLRSILKALEKISKDIPIILPLHPRTKQKLKAIDKQAKTKNQNLIFIEPIGYLNMIWLIDNCSMVMTDSGGLQKEAYFFNKPCITLRDETEWVELVENGYNTIAGANSKKIVEAYNYSLQKKFNFDINLYGNRKASEHIINYLIDFL